MQLTITNLTESTKTYLSSTISVAGNSSTTITDTTQKLSLATDGQLRSDLLSALVQLSDGINTFGSVDGIAYLALLITNLNTVASGINKASNADPSSGSQLPNWANSTVPATATLSNIVAGYTTLGGQFTFTNPAGAETDYALFAFQVPTGVTLHITDVVIYTKAGGSANTNQIISIEWALGVNASAVSLASGTPIRIPLGCQSNDINGLVGGSLNVGNMFTPPNITNSFKTPLVCDAGKYVHIILRVPTASIGTNQGTRGTVTVLGYFE